MSGSKTSQKINIPAGWRFERINERAISIIDANGSRTTVFGSSTTGPYERTLYALAAALLAQDGDK